MKINEILNEDGVIVPGVNTTVDVKLGQTEKEAKKFFGGNGKPKPIGVPGATPNQAFNLGLTESSNLVLTRANIIPYIKDILADYLDQERDINKLNNMLRLLVGRQIKAHGKRYEITKEDVSIAIAQELEDRQEPVEENLAEGFFKSKEEKQKIKDRKLAIKKHKEIEKYVRKKDAYVPVVTKAIASYFLKALEIKDPSTGNYWSDLHDSIIGLFGHMKNIQSNEVVNIVKSIHQAVRDPAWAIVGDDYRSDKWKDHGEFIKTKVGELMNILPNNAIDEKGKTLDPLMLHYWAKYHLSHLNASSELGTIVKKALNTLINPNVEKELKWAKYHLSHLNASSELRTEDVSIAIAQLNEIENAGGQGVKKDDADRYDFDSMIGAAEPSGERIGKYEIWVIEDDNDDFVLLIKDPNSEGFLGEFRLQHDSNTGTHKSTVFFDKEIQGLGMGPRLYEFAIKKWKKTIVSDYQQSTGSKMLWAKLAKIPGVFVYAWNPKTDEFFQWDPAADPDEDVYFDTEQNTKLQSELFKINLALRKGEYDGDEQHKNLIKMAKAKAAEIDQLSHAHGKDIRLVATAEQKSK